MLHVGKISMPAAAKPFPKRVFLIGNGICTRDATGIKAHLKRETLDGLRIEN